MCCTLQFEHCQISPTCLVPRETAKYQSESHYLSCQSLQTEWRPGEDNEVGRNLSEENFLNFKTKVDSCCFCQDLSCIPRHSTSDEGDVKRCLRCGCPHCHCPVSCWAVGAAHLWGESAISAITRAYTTRLTTLRNPARSVAIFLVMVWYGN